MTRKSVVPPVRPGLQRIELPPGMLEFAREKVLPLVLEDLRFPKRPAIDTYAWCYVLGLCHAQDALELSSEGPTKP